MGFRREPVFLVVRVFDSDSVEFLDLRLLDRRDSSCTSPENLSAPVAREVKASPAVFAAAVPKAAASLRLDVNAAIAICSPALIASSEETRWLFILGSRFESFFLEFPAALERELLDKVYDFDCSLAYLRWKI